MVCQLFEEQIRQNDWIVGQRGTTVVAPLPSLVGIQRFNINWEVRTSKLGSAG